MARRGGALGRLLAAACCLGAALGAAAADLIPIQVAPRVYYFQGEAGPASQSNEGYMSNAGFVVTDDQVVAIDALGTPALGEAMLAAIRRVTPLPVKLVIVTHYHADHYYGLQAFKAVGAEVWAQTAAKGAVDSDAARERLAQRRRDLPLSVDEHTRLVPPDILLAGDTTVRRGGVDFRITAVGGAHSPEDLMVLVPGQGVLFAGDLFFAGRLPFVGDADTGRWLQALDRMQDGRPAVVVPGHGAASRDPLPDIDLTRRYLAYLRETMGRAVAELIPFEEAYARTDWSAFAGLPAFAAANRGNAYNVYIGMEQEALGR